MLVIHTDSGLGNQMLDYIEFLMIQKENPDQECYLENLIYEIPQHDGMFSMWNGYELERIFGIKIPNIRSHFSKDAWERILNEVEKSCFWRENWNYAPYIVKAFRKEGLSLLDHTEKRYCVETKRSIKIKIRHLCKLFFRTELGYYIKRYLRLLMERQLVKKNQEQYRVFRRYPENSYVGHSLAFKLKGFGMEDYAGQIRSLFQFPPIMDSQNQKLLELIQSTNSVAVHARRSDMLFVNEYCYKYGFFKRSVHYIKKHVDNPVFIFFTDENSVGWCEKNESVFGLDFHKDQVEFVTWNTGQESFRDMQLMAQCKHNIFTESSFGFWGAYLNENPHKITCTPDCTIFATNTF